MGIDLSHSHILGPVPFSSFTFYSIRGCCGSTCRFSNSRLLWSPTSFGGRGGDYGDCPGPPPAARYPRAPRPLRATVHVRAEAAVFFGQQIARFSASGGRRGGWPPRRLGVATTCHRDAPPGSVCAIRGPIFKPEFCGRISCRRGADSESSMRLPWVLRRTNYYGLLLVCSVATPVLMADATVGTELCREMFFKSVVLENTLSEGRSRKAFDRSAKGVRFKGVSIRLFHFSELEAVPGKHEN